MIPVSLAESNKPVRMNLMGQGVIIGDVHVPYHDQDAVECMITWAKANKHTDWLLINGDFADFYSVSRWEKDPRKRDLLAELEDVKTLLKHLKGIFKQVIYKAGNHESRYSRYLTEKAPELLSIPALQLDRILELRELGIKYVPEHKPILLGPHLYVFHGHEIRLSGGVSPARTLFLRVKSNAIAGHLHRASQNTEVLPDGRTVSTWTHGCLCGLNPDYLPVNMGWVHGFAAVTLEGKGGCRWRVQNLRILADGQIV